MSSRYNELMDEKGFNVSSNTNLSRCQRQTVSLPVWVEKVNDPNKGYDRKLMKDICLIDADPIDGVTWELTIDDSWGNINGPLTIFPCSTVTYLVAFLIKRCKIQVCCMAALMG